MTSITEFIDDHDLEAEDVIDALDIDPAQFTDYPEEPSEFYDGEPTVDELREDFTAVDVLADSKEDLESDVEELETELKATKREEFEDAAEDLVEYTDRFGDEDDLVEKFENDEMTVDEIEQQLAVIKDAVSTETTTVGGSESEDDEFADNEDGRERLSNGGVDLRQRTKFTE